MARLAIVVDRSVDERDFEVLSARLRDAGHDLVLVGPESNREVAKGVFVELTVDDASAEQVDGLVVMTRGERRNHIRTHERLLNFVRDVYAQGKPVGALREFGFVLLKAEVLGHSLITWPTIKRNLIIEDDPSVADDLTRDAFVFSESKDVNAFADMFLGQLDRGPRGAPEPSINPATVDDPVASAYGPAPSP